MKFFREMQLQLKNNYSKFVTKLTKNDSSYNYAMKNNKMTGCCTLSINSET